MLGVFKANIGGALHCSYIVGYFDAKKTVSNHGPVSDHREGKLREIYN